MSIPTTDHVLRCPACEHVIRAPFYEHATFTGHRTCRFCSRRWWLVIHPLSRTPEVYTHEVNWTLTEAILGDVRQPRHRKRGVRL